MATAPMAAMNQGGGTSARAILTKGRPHVCSGSFATELHCQRDVRFPPKATEFSDITACLKTGCDGPLMRARGIETLEYRCRLVDASLCNKIEASRLPHRGWSADSRASRAK